MEVFLNWFLPLRFGRRGGKEQLVRPFPYREFCHKAITGAPSFCFEPKGFICGLTMGLPLLFNESQIEAWYLVLGSRPPGSDSKARKEGSSWRWKLSGDIISC